STERRSVCRRSSARSAGSCATRPSPTSEDRGSSTSIAPPTTTTIRSRSPSDRKTTRTFHRIDPIARPPALGALQTQIWPMLLKASCQEAPDRVMLPTLKNRTLRRHGRTASRWSEDAVEDDRFYWEI